MSNSSTPRLCLRSARIIHIPYVDDKTVECVDLDKYVSIVYRHLGKCQYHPLHFCLFGFDTIGSDICRCVTMFEFLSSF